jgi:hypothetical protein
VVSPRDLFGVRVEWASEVGHHEDPVARLLGLLPPADLPPPTSLSESDPRPRRATTRGLFLDVKGEGQLEADGAPESLSGEGYRASFFHGQMRGFERDGAFLLVAPGARVAVTRDGTRIVARIDAARMDETSFADTTLFVALCIALRRHGMFHMHAGAVVREDGTRVLVIGDSGAGKSTVTMSLVDAAAQHLGDDALFLARRDGAACLLGFPRPFHLGPVTLAAFPELDLRDTVGVHGAKRAVPLASLPGRPVDRMAPPHVVLFPEVTRADTTRAEALSPADAFGRALRSSALLVVDGMGDAAEQLALLRELFADARAFDLHLGADWLIDPRAAAARLLATR